MKKMKRIFALTLAMLMASILAIPTFAETTKGTITVENANSGATYTAYKIFDVTYNTDQTAYSYTIAKDSPWLETIITYMEKTKDEGTKTYTGKGLTLTLSANGTEYVVTKNELAEGETATAENTFSAADFAQALYAALNGYTVVASDATFDSDTTYYIHENGQYVECEDLTGFASGVTYYTKGDGLSVTGTELTKNSETGKATASGLDLGYYFVTTSLGALADLTTTHPTATIYDKNEYPTIDKKQKDTEDGTYANDTLSVEVGDTVYYEITGKVPSTEGYSSSYEYKISDTLSDGLTLDKTNVPVVKIGDTEVTLTEGTDPLSTDCTYRYTDNGFEIYFDMTKHQDDVGKTITVTYSAVVNDTAVAAVSTNTATLDYSNDPNDSTSTEKTTDETDVYTSKIVIDKYASSDESTKLSDAEFVLYKTVTTTESDGTTSSSDLYYQAVYAYTYTDTTTNNTVTVYSADGTTYYSDTALETEYTLPENTTLSDAVFVAINWVTDRASATVVTTDSTGAAEFDGLEDGTYYLLETAAPDGYNLLTNPVTVKVDPETHANEVTTDRVAYARTSNIDANIYATLLTYNVGIENSTGEELPSTGGIGTTIFYILGAILLVGAGIILIARRRMNGAK